jgi:hypothetical protein
MHEFTRRNSIEFVQALTVNVLSEGKRQGVRVVAFRGETLVRTQGEEVLVRVLSSGGWV